MRKPATASLVFAAVLLAGCATTSHVMLAPPRPAIAPAQVRVYFTPPPGRYVEIALLETASGPFTYGEQNKMDAVMARLRAEAASLGANGVLVQGMANGYRGGGGVGVDISPTQKHAQATAIFVE